MKHCIAILFVLSNLTSMQHIKVGVNGFTVHPNIAAQSLKSSIIRHQLLGLAALTANLIV
jgi:hypothetical protein